MCPPRPPLPTRPPPDTIQICTPHILWQKERLLNLALQHLPDNINKIAWLDCDILFTNPNWATETAKQLDHHPIVQPYQKYPEHLTQGGCPVHGQTGYAWAARHW